MRDALSADAVIRRVVFCPELLGEAEHVLRQQIARLPGTPHCLAVSPVVMRSLAETQTPQGVLAVVELPDPPIPVFDVEGGFVLVLDGVRDPGNVGTLIRAAAAANCDAVVTITGTADAFAPKVVRSAMGAHFRVPIIAEREWAAIGPTLAALPAIYGADGASPVTYDMVDWGRGCAIIIGNEDHGLSAQARAAGSGTVRIPMARGVESLNAAISGAILLYEVVRQRRHAWTA